MVISGIGLMIAGSVKAKKDQKEIVDAMLNLQKEKERLATRAYPILLIKESDN